MSQDRLALVVYTTRYRGGSPELARVARTLRDELAAEGLEVWLVPTERKRDFTEAIAGVGARGRALHALHFVGHSGMYGPMFGSTAYPEQLSPHEWRALAIPFAQGAEAHFHACRTARWFAPFFARTFGVVAYGHHGYTTFSRSAERFVWEGPVADGSAPLHAIACPGRKTHGLLGGLRKYATAVPAEPMRRASPEDARGSGSYDAVADLYDAAFTDITRRRVEWRYVRRRLDAAFGASKPRVLDLGCGNGALLRALADRIGASAGVDASAKMIGHAIRRSAGYPHLSFQTVDGPKLPFADAAFDVVIAFLSFRYLDWDPIVAEIRRVLAPGGRLLVVDMVERPLALEDAPVLARSVYEHVVRRASAPDFDRALAALTSHPDWAVMLAHNPIRAEHEYRWYFESRFPGRRLETLTVTRTQRLVAFDTGPITCAPIAELAYP